MDIVTVKRMLAILEPQLSESDFSVARKTMNREYLYHQIDICTQAILLKQNPTDNAIKITKFEQQLAAL